MHRASGTFIIMARVSSSFVGGCISIKSFKMAVQKGDLAPVTRFGFPLLVLALAALVYGLYGFDGVLLRDYSIYLYSGQMMAEGIPPYVSVFDHKGPLSPMIAGFGAMLSKVFGGDDVYAVRFVFYATACLTVVAIYLLGKSVFQSQKAGFLAALTFLGFYAYAQAAASGPEPKTPMVLFEALCLMFMVRKKWFWSGLFGSLAFLVWQPMGAFAFVTFLLAATRPREERYGAALRAAAGIAVPLVATAAYFLYKGALYDFYNGFILFNFTHLARGSTDIAHVLAGAAVNIALPYATMLVPILIGLLTILRLYFKRPFEYRFLPLLLTLPAPVIWSLRDFQLADDFYVFLPYAAVGFGAFLDTAARLTSNPRLLSAILGAILLTIALANTWDEVSAGPAQKLTGTTVDLPTQRAGALEIEERFGEDINIASINSPQVLVLLHRQNPNPYLWITAGVDQEIEASYPGGFEGWLQDLEDSDTGAISFFGEGQSLLPSSLLTRENYKTLDAWLNPRYRAEQIGPFWLFVKKDLLLEEARRNTNAVESPGSSESLVDAESR
ncbi:MAG: hypothetical protein AVDCRST_MAG28-3036 [uncultured Rubrobacteraceae bacterium]|uniref:Glycosyltransferase RgtA/B/C/D-like domain-containing protein n=1 Tax=uncultured Rubrobacteraceae bacterium TaxID=349277 RepID=A0A6J4R156_9ACTN|nr:MAG: hypothetical protein AVDCRST_MAG28-3036 [uncultured Rubrobacteraceae bacterium]